jgi:D-inositol-3-phosphate glycosyltransferase
MVKPTPIGKPLHIAMFSIHSSPDGELGTRNTGGMSVYIKSLAHHLGARGHRVDIFTCAAQGRSLESWGPNVRLIQLWSDAQSGVAKEQWADHIDQIFQRVEEYRHTRQMCYDVVHSHYWVSGLVVMQAQVRWHCPHVMMFHTLGLLKNKKASGEHEPVRRIMQEGRLVQSTHHIIVPSEQERVHLQRYYQADPEKISVIPCGVDLHLFRPSDRVMERRRLNVSETAQVLIFVGRLAPLKGVDRLIEALARLVPRYSELALMIIGGDGSDDADTRALTQSISRHGLEKNVRLVGRVEHDHLPHYYAAADFLVLPSQYESFGLVVLESLACGTPVAATPVGAAGMIVHPGRNGFLFDGPAVEDLVQGLDRLLSVPIAQRPSPQQVRSSVLELDWENISTQVAQVYAHMLRQHAA